MRAGDGRLEIEIVPTPVTKRGTNEIGTHNSVLIVVGRKDTGELEAQVRGSRHAWDMRLISVDSLVRLVKLKESTAAPDTGTKIRSLLVPVEYTRLDLLIDVMFTAAKDVENSVDAEQQPSEDAVEGDAEWVFTDPTLLAAKRDKIVAALGKELGQPLIKKSRALFWSADHSLRAVCTVSKRYTKKGATPYWYAYHPQWDEFLAEAAEGRFVLGCMDLHVAFAIPAAVLRPRLEELSTTTRGDGTAYWHVKIIALTPNRYALQIPKSGNHLDLAPFEIAVPD